jgi:hypothetical protein
LVIQVFVHPAIDSSILFLDSGDLIRLRPADLADAYSDAMSRGPRWRDEAIDTPSVPRLTGGPVCTLATFNCRGGGPPFLKLGTAVRCRRRTVLRWFAGSLVR